MKDFLINNAGAIGSWFGFFVVVFLLLTAKTWMHTKWFDVFGICFGLFAFVGAMRIFTNIAEFLAK